MISFTSLKDWDIFNNPKVNHIGVLLLFCVFNQKKLHCIYPNLNSQQLCEEDSALYYFELQWMKSSIYEISDLVKVAQIGVLTFGTQSFCF